MIRFWLDKQVPAGTMIDGWKVVRLLGDGGFGAVFLVERDGQRYALKLSLRREASRDDQRTHARMMRELSILMMLEHPNIIKPLAFGRWGDPRKGHAYFVMDHVVGWTLAQWVKRMHPTFREIIRVFRKLGRRAGVPARQGDFPPGPEAGERAVAQERRAAGAH